MFNLKKVLFAVIISCSIGTMSVYSTTAASASKSMRPNKEVAKDVVNSLNEALSAVENKESKETILGLIQNARQFSKEINVGSLGAMVDRGADAIVSSRRNVKNDDMDAAVVSLNLAIKTYTEMGKKTL
jgi:hypothetical protein